MLQPLVLCQGPGCPVYAGRGGGRRPAPAGTVIIEPTSGNTGVALAYIANIRGYKLILTMPDTMSTERRNLLSALGAELMLTPGGQGMEGAVAKARELAASLPSAFIPSQFDNPANAQAHYRTTGPEIWRDTEGQVDVFVACVGSGGTITGTGRYLKEQNPPSKWCRWSRPSPPCSPAAGPAPTRSRGSGPTSSLPSGPHRL